MEKGIFRKSINRSIGGNMVVFLMVLFLGSFMILPLVFAVSSAFKPLDEIYIFPPRFFVRRPTLDNFIQLKLISESFWVPLSKYIFNSIFVSIVATTGHLIMSSMAAYPLAKLHFVGRDFLRSLIRLSLLFTSSAMLIPQYMVMSKLYLVNTYAALIFPAFQAALGLYLMQNFMSQIPDEMLESSRIDGANEFRVYWQIVMPNVKPAWLTVIIFAFQGIWNNTGATQVSTLVYDEKIKMLSSIFSQVVASGTARAGAGAALGFLLMIPPLVLFILSQSRIIETMSTSGMK